MKTGDRITRKSNYGVALAEGSIRTSPTREVARQCVRMFAVFGKKAYVIKNVHSSGVVTR